MEFPLNCLIAKWNEDASLGFPKALMDGLLQAMVLLISINNIPGTLRKACSQPHLDQLAIYSVHTPGTPMPSIFTTMEDYTHTTGENNQAGTTRFALYHGRGMHTFHYSTAHVVPTLATCSS